MADKFENIISQQLNDFKLNPSPTVWQEVDAALRPNKKRRLLIWWWLPLLGLLVGGLFLMERNKKQDFKEQGSKIQVNKVQENEEQGLKCEALKNKKSEIQDYKYQIDKGQKNNTTIIKPNLSNQQKKQRNFTPFVNKEGQTQRKKTDSETTTNAIIKNKIEVEIAYKNIDVTAIVAKLIDTATITEDSSKAIARTLADTNLQWKAIVKPITKKQQWFLVLGGGFLNTPLGNNYGDKAAGGAFLSSSLPPNVVTNREVVPQPTNGISLKIGLEYVTTLSKHWQLQTGLQYVYLQNHLMLKNDTAAIFPNSYVAGNNFRLTNKAHLLQVPVSLSYNFNATAKNRLSILFGGSLAWAFLQQWLITDNANRRLYYYPSLNNKLLLGLHGGIVFNQNNRFKIAVLTDYSVTPIHKNTTDNYHFLQYNLQISTPINFKKQSSTKK